MGRRRPGPSPPPPGAGASLFQSLLCLYPYLRCLGRKGGGCSYFNLTAPVFGCSLRPPIGSLEPRARLLSLCKDKTLTPKYLLLLHPSIRATL